MSTKKKSAPKAQPSTPSKPMGRSLEEFRANHDKSFIVPAKIKAALEKLGNGWQSELEFAKLAGLSMTDLGAYRAQFDAFVVPISRDGSRRVWAGTKAFASRMREMIQ